MRYEEGKIKIEQESDIIAVRRLLRDITRDLGISGTDITRILTVASELTRNIYKYAGSGYMQWRLLNRNERQMIELQFKDSGPGIADIDQAMQPGYTTSKGLGMGLPGSKRLMDEMQIDSITGCGTTVTVRKYLAIKIK